ncbi:P-loop NTPase fold protein [Priestia megaterium]|uniref:P-loop NTPase fold protein n=1 Tax=Priestia megaterium TaxID=1404 RepID=UPI002E1FDFE2|nr:P-loop NTPase fold protein [Priestia megaterium]
MELLREVIKRYLSKELTDYALNIDGSWGSGKTYFIKNKLNDLFGESGNYILMYNSLNGLNKPEDLISMLESSIFPYGTPNNFNNEPLKSNLLKFIEAKKAKILLCLDDLERIDDKCSVSSVLGYINTYLIEHNNIKTIIISNEGKIKEEEIFSEIKEKVIGRTIRFNADNLSIFKSIISNYPELQKFHLKNNELIDGVFTAYDSVNFRSIRFLFEILEEVFSYLAYDENSLDVEDNTLNDILLGIFVFCFIAGIEYRKGTFRTTTDSVNILDPFRSHFYKIDETNPNPVNELRKNNVIINNLYRYYNSLSEFIINGHFSKGKLISEIKEKYYIKGIEDSSFGIIESYENYELPEIINSFSTVINAIEEGGYNPLRYPYMYLVVKELLDKEYINFEGSLENSFLKGLEVAYHKTALDVADELRFNRHFEDSVEPIYVQLVNLLKEKRRLTIDQRNSSQIDEYINALKKNDYSLISKSVAYFSSSLNFFQYLSRNEWQKEFILLSNRSLNSFIVTLNQMYLKISNANEFYSSEAIFMEEFKTKLTIELENSKGVDKLKRDQIENILLTIDKVITHVRND